MTIALEIQNKLRKDGKSRLRIRVYDPDAKVKIKRFSTELIIEPKYVDANASFGKWIKRSHQHFADLNEYLKGEFLKYQENDALTLQNNKVPTLLSYANKLENRKAGLCSAATIKQFKSKITHIAAFLKDEKTEYNIDVKLKYVNKSFVKDFQSYLLKEGKSLNTVRSILSALRLILNNAIEDGLFEHANYPFGKNGLKIGTIEGTRAHLNAEQVEKLQKLKVTGWRKYSKDVFLLQMYLEGMRISDVLRLKIEKIEKNVLYWTEKKKHYAERAIELNPLALEIINEYKGKRKTGYLWPFMEDETDNTISAKTALVNKFLKPVGKKIGVEKLTSHSSRHSLAHLADKNGLSLLEIQKMLNHSRATTTDTYLKSINIEVSRTSQKLFGK